MTAPAAAAGSCRGCGAELARTFLSCPACRTLVHAESLATLAARADEREAAGDVTGALSAWRDALSLLPDGAPQVAPITAHVERLSATVSDGAASASPGRGRRFGAIGTVVVAVLAKAKFLLLGLSKLGTLSSLFAWFALYWALYGWRFAAGIAASIYVHEMGHVAMLARYGVRAGAPMFMPGVGAWVRARQPLVTPIEVARVGLAGPVWGLAAALAALAAYTVTGAPVWAVIAHWGAVLNMANLTPVWQLDGARGVTSLSTPQRWVLAVGLAVAGLALGNGWLLAMAAAACWAATRPAPARGDAVGLVTFAGLGATLLAVIVGTGGVAAMAGAAR